MALPNQAIRLLSMVQVSMALEGSVYEFKIFPPLLLARPKYLPFRDMFCLYHFWAKIHSVTRKTTFFEGMHSATDLISYFFINHKHIFIRCQAQFAASIGTVFIIFLLLLGIVGVKGFSVLLYLSNKNCLTTKRVKIKVSQST